LDSHLADARHASYRDAAPASRSASAVSAPIGGETRDFRGNSVLQRWHRFAKSQRCSKNEICWMTTKGRHGTRAVSALVASIGIAGAAKNDGKVNGTGRRSNGGRIGGR
jgi:hypothetical protein